MPDAVSEAIPFGRRRSPRIAGGMICLVMTAALGPPLAWGLTPSSPDPAIRWVKASPLLVRSEGQPDAPVLERLQQGSQVRVTQSAEGSAYCRIAYIERQFHGADEGWVACQYLSPQAVAPIKAGVAGVPADRRWAAGRAVLLRAAAHAQASVLARLALNSELTLRTPTHIEGDYCAVSAPQQGYVACRYLESSPVAVERMASQGWMRSDAWVPNPDYNPRKVFWLAPHWDWLSRYEVQQGEFCSGSHCPPKDKDYTAERQRMHESLHGQLVTDRAVIEPLARWSDLGQDPALFTAHAGLHGETYSQASGLARAKALWQAVPMMTVRPSWFRNEEDLASPHATLSQLAQRFDAQQRWYVAKMLPAHQSTNARLERLTKATPRIELLRNGHVRGQVMQAELLNHAWRPDIEASCEQWHAGFMSGDVDDATWRRNNFGARTTPTQPLLFWFHSSRPLPASAPPSLPAQTLKLDPKRTGMSQLDIRHYDLDGDGTVDLMWVQGTGRGPGHLEPLQHDDPWWRLLLVNIQGEWRLLASDALSYGCGC